MFVHKEVAGMNPAYLCAQMYVYVCVLHWETDGCGRVINTCVCVCVCQIGFPW